MKKGSFINLHRIVTCHTSVIHQVSLLGNDTRLASVDVSRGSLLEEETWAAVYLPIGFYTDSMSTHLSSLLAASTLLYLPYRLESHVCHTDGTLNGTP